MTGIETARLGTLHDPSMKTYPTSQTQLLPLKYELAGQLVGLTIVVVGRTVVVAAGGTTVVVAAGGTTMVAVVGGTTVVVVVAGIVVVVADLVAVVGAALAVVVIVAVGLVTIVVVVVVVVVLAPLTHCPPTKMNPSSLGQVLQATPPSL